MSDRGRIAIFISGGGTNMEAIVKACKEGRVPAEPVVVVSNNPDAYGLVRADNLGVPSIVVDHREFEDRVEHEKEVVRRLEAFAPIDLVCLAGYMRVVTPYLLDHFYNKKLGLPGVINIHPADTRAYQGTHGYEFALGLIPNSERLDRTWITVHFVDPGVDTGPVIKQEPVDVHPDDTLDTLRERGLKVEHRIYPEVVRLYVEGKIRLEDGVVTISE